MELDFVYADLQVDIIFDADTDSPFNNLSDNERAILGKLLYLTLVNFCWVRAMQEKERQEILKDLDKISSNRKLPHRGD